MSNTTMAVEKYLPPKELSGVVCAEHGICVTADRIREIRIFLRAKKSKLFVMGMARPSEFVAWIIDHGDEVPSRRKLKSGVS